MNDRPHILVVDDDASTRRTLSLILARKGYAVETAETGAAALAWARQQPFDAALLDIRLADVEGIELLAPLRQTQPDIVLILATGYASLETALRALNEGADAYVTKPLDMDALLARLADLLERQRLRRENQRLYELAQYELAERKRTEEALRARNRELSVLNRLGTALAETLDIERICRIAYEHLQELIDCPNFGISLYDAATRTLRAGLMLEDGHPLDVSLFPPLHIPADAPLRGRAGALLTGQPQIVETTPTPEPQDGAVLVGSERVPLSALYMPMQAQGQIIGLIEMQSYRPHAYGEAEISLLRPVANQVGLAVQNARLFAVERQTARRMQSLYETGRTLASSLDEEHAIRAILQAISKTLGCEHAILSVVNDQERTIGIRHGLWQGEFDRFPAWIAMSQYSLDEPDILCDVVRSGRTEIIGEWDDRFNRAIWKQFGHERFLRIFMPIKIKNRVIGVIEVAYDKATKPRIEADEIEMLEALMDQAAVALENTRLFAETGRRAARLRAMYEIDQAILAAQSAQEIAQTALTHLRRQIPSTAGLVVLFDLEAGQSFTLALDQDRPIGIEVGMPIPLKQDEQLEALQRGEISVLTDLSTVSDLPPALQRMRESGIRTHVAAPLLVGGRLIGILSLVAERSLIWTAEQTDILREVANQIAVALHNARLEAERRTEQERLRTLIDNLPEGVVLLDAERHILLANPMATGMLNRLEISRHAPLNQLGPYSLDELLRAGQTTPLTLDLDRPRCNLEAAAYKIKSQAEPGDVLLLLRDVTELRQAQNRAHQRERLAAVGRLSGSIAHDFNNILTAIIGYTDYVRDALRSDNPLDWPPATELRADLEQISLAANRAAALTRQLLMFSRRERGQPQILNLNELIAAMSKMLIPLLGEDITISLSLEETPALIEADPGQIEQVVMNLVVNARDAMPRGGPLTISTARVQWSTPHPLSHGRAPAGTYIRLSVQDTGIGMSQAVMEHLFEPFFTTKSPDKGTGLGLSTVYGIVQQSNGYIDVHSEPGHGTRFDIYLPYVEIPLRVDSQKKEETHLPTEPVAPEAQPKQTILVVEDEESVRELARRILERRGYIVLTASGPGEALLISERHSGPIDLLLTDVIMPGLNGPELAERIATQRSGIRTLFMSGYTGDALARSGTQIGTVQISSANLLPKPFEAAELHRRVQQMLSEISPILPPAPTAPAGQARTAPHAPREWSDLARDLQTLQPGEQLCHIYQDENECCATASSFVRQGLDQRHKILCLTDPLIAQRIWNLLAQEGVDVEALLAAGQLVCSHDEQPLSTPHTLIAWLHAQAEHATAEGYIALRVVHDMAWLGRHWPTAAQINEFEVQLNDLLSTDPLLVICHYNRQHFDAPTLLDVLHMHPLVILDGQICNNFYYTGSLHPSLAQAETTLERWLANLESRRRFEAAIRQSEQKLHSFIEHSDDAIVLTDEEGRVTEWNQGAEHIFGLDATQALGRPLWDVQYQIALPEVKKAENYENLKKALQDGLKNGRSPLLNILRETEIQRPDGARRTVQTLAFAIQTEQGFILANTSRDVTERKRAEEALLRSEARYRSLIEHLPAIIYETPFGETSPSFYTGPQIEALLGFGQKEWSASRKLWLKQLHPDDRMRVLTALAKSHESGQPFVAEYRLISRDRRPIWFHDEAVVVRDEHGKPLFLHGIMLEINERKQAEEDLRWYAMHLALLNELGQQIAAELDLDGVLKQAAYLAQQSFGYHHVSLFILDPERNELVMRACAGAYVDLFPPDHRLKVEQGIVGWVARHGERLLANDVRQQPQYINLYPDRINTRSELAVPIRTGGEVVGVLDVQSPNLNAFNENDMLVLETMADQIAVAIKNARLYAALAQERASLARRVEERTAELSLANAELARAARLKDEFLANMSHELRTPLNAILGLSEAVLEGVYGPLTEKQRKSLQNIGEAGQHLLSLVNDILDVAKAEAGKLELQMGPVAVRDLCQVSLGLVRQIANQKRLQVSLDIDEQVESFEGDQRRLKQVLVNLLSNAVKFTPEGGQIGLQVTGDPQEKRIAFTVWDTGIGIAQEDMNRLFQPFVQLDGSLSRQYAGTGLGLVLVRRLVELHGGGVAVESEVGKGSRFTVFLPWNMSPNTPPEADAPTAKGSSSMAVPANIAFGDCAPLILLAEDNPANLAVFRDYLLAKGYRMIVAHNGREAVELAHTQHPDLILMDIQLPEMDGLTAIHRLRTEGQSCPIIALTALVMPGDRERCLQAGANDYLSKPVGMGQLLAAIARQLETRTPPEKG